MSRWHIKARVAVGAVTFFDGFDQHDLGVMRLRRLYRARADELAKEMAG